jgi:SAM-dependent methyltransferase
MSTNDHLGGWVPGGDGGTFSPDVWQELITHYNVRSVVDVGCAEGWNLAWFIQHKINGLGVEGDPAAFKNSPVRGFIHQHDYTSGPFKVAQQIDLCWCSEFVEHVDQKYVQNFIETFKCCRVVAMTHAVPGQGGHHHVNEQPAKYWVDLLAKNGLAYNPQVTMALRKIGRGYVKASLLLFENNI